MVATRSAATASAMGTKTESAVKLYRCEPTAWLWMPRPVRNAIAHVTIALFSASFLIVPICAAGLPLLWHFSPVSFAVASVFLTVSMILPQKEWAAARKLGQLWYEPFQFSCNLSPEECDKTIKLGNLNQYAIGMHPHGIIPIHAILWSGYCDQYLSSADGSMYGFGATADVVMYLPILRTIMGWLTGGSAEYSVLKDGIEKGICSIANRVGRWPRHLYILPGGVAEIFVSTPGKHAIIFKNRRGLIKLALETGVNLIPCYVFGGTDFFNNLATGDSWLSSLSRKYRMGITFFWGQYGLPIPFYPRVTMCIADPIHCKKWTGNGPIPADLIEELHQQYINSIVNLFDKYKASAGYPDATLEVL